MKQASPINSGYTPTGTHLVINQPAANVQAAPVTAPMTMVEQAESFLKVADVIKRLQPEQTTMVQQREATSESQPLEERLFQAITLKALESDKVPIDRLLDAIGGNRHKEPGIMEGILEILKAFAPTIDKVVQQVLATQRAAMSTAGVSSASPGNPARLSGAPVESAPEGSNSQDGVSQAVDPIARDWFQVMIRLLEDCTRHVELASVGGGAKSVVPSAEAIVELMERYPEQLGPTIGQLLSASPEQVIDMCCMMLDERGQQHVNSVLRPAPTALTWIGELQGECNKIISDAAEDAKEEDDTPRDFSKALQSDS
jgi:hypothetical protein